MNRVEDFILTNYSSRKGCINFIKEDYKVACYLSDLDSFTLGSRTRISEAIKQRILQRYIWPCENSSCRNGFNIMANCCLVIETLESFHRGWKSSPTSALAFCNFFNRSIHFIDFVGNDTPYEFYKKVRCGILHQGETEGGWRIRRDDSDIINLTEKTINAEKFLCRLKKEINGYFSGLIAIEGKNTNWKPIIKKMGYIISNCEA